MTLEFGLNGVAPKRAKAIFGARLIWPDDLVPNRKSWIGYETPAGQTLREWLNNGALRKALDAVEIKTRADKSQLVTLYEDETGIVKGNANASYGYCYIAAWLKK